MGGRGEKAGGDFNLNSVSSSCAPSRLCPARWTPSLCLPPVGLICMGFMRKRCALAAYSPSVLNKHLSLSSDFCIPCERVTHPMVLYLALAAYSLARS